MKEKDVMQGVCNGLSLKRGFGGCGHGFEGFIGFTEFGGFGGFRF